MLQVHSRQLITQAFSTHNTLRYSYQHQVLRLLFAADDPTSAGCLQLSL